MVKKLLVSICLLCISLPFLSGCSNLQENQIREDYLDFMHNQGEIEMIIEDVHILNNYGTYNGAVVIRMKRSAYEVITTINIAGVNFTFSNTNTALVWKDGYFYELSDAYNNDILTKDNLITIAKRVNK